MPDYYQILGVSPSASFDEIKRAYRLRAVKCHPDRGGTHEEMVLVNLAWEYLSDPMSRQRYDEARTGNSSMATQAASAADATKAHDRAQRYARSWADFEKWIDTVADTPFSGVSGPFGIPWPNAANSASGWCFIIVFGAFGLLFYFTYFENRIGSGGFVAFTAMYLMMAISIASAWCGVLCHQWIARFLQHCTRLKASSATYFEWLQAIRRDNPQQCAILLFAAFAVIALIARSFDRTNTIQGDWLWERGSVESSVNLAHLSIHGTTVKVRLYNRDGTMDLFSDSRILRIDQRWDGTMLVALAPLVASEEMKKHPRLLIASVDGDVADVRLGSAPNFGYVRPSLARGFSLFLPFFGSEETSEQISNSFPWKFRRVGR